MASLATKTMKICFSFVFLRFIPMLLAINTKNPIFLCCTISMNVMCAEHLELENASKSIKIRWRLNASPGE